MKSVIVFIPTAYYLSDPIYTKVPRNKDFLYVYFDTSEASVAKVNTSHKVLIEDSFDFHIKLPPDMYSGTNTLLLLVSMHVKAWQIKRLLYRLNPKVIVSVTDGSLTAKVISRYFPETTFLLLQTALLNVLDKKFLRKRRKSYEVIYPFFERLLYPYFSSTFIFGLNHPKTKLLLWGETTKQVYKDSKQDQDVFLVGTPLLAGLENSNRGRKSILVLVPDPDSMDEQMIYFDEMVDLVRSLPEYDFILRTHPLRISPYLSQRCRDENISNAIIDDMKTSIIDRIVASDLVISSYSTATFDALSLKRPVFLYRKHVSPVLAYWFQSSTLPAFTDIQNLIESLRIFNWGGAARVVAENDAFLKETCAFTGQESLGKIAEVINKHAFMS